MNVVFADTSFYLALINPNDFHHERASRWSRSYHGRIVTTEYVLLELGNTLARGRWREVFLILIGNLQQDKDTVVISASAELFRRGVDLFMGRPDKEWSLTDCISFVVVDQQQLSVVLATDRHFVQAGYTLAF